MSSTPVKDFDPRARVSEPTRKDRTVEINLGLVVVALIVLAGFQWSSWTTTTSVWVIGVTAWGIALLWRLRRRTVEIQSPRTQTTAHAKAVERWEAETNNDLASVDRPQGVETELVVRAQILDAVVNQAPVGVMLIAPDERIRMLFGQLGMILGLTRDFSYGQKLENVFADTPDVVRAVRAGSSGVSRTYWTENERHLEMLAQPFENRDGAIDGVICVLTDVTEREVMRDLQDAFVATINHQLRTPLTSIAGYLEVALVDPTLPPGMRPWLDSALRNAHRMQGLVSNVGCLDRPFSNDEEPLDVASLPALITGAFASIENGHPDRLRVLVDKELEGRLRAVEDTFRSIIEPLLKNAVTYAAEGTPIVVQLRIARAERALEIRVANQGDPIPERIRDRLFDRFVIGDNSDARQHYGLGIGLYVAANATHSADGRIWLEASTAERTVFACSLPLHDPEKNAAAAAAGTPA